MMDITILILQGIIAFIFLFSGLHKAYFDQATLVQKGQTGVAGLPSWFIKFVGVSEIIGAIAIVLPDFINKWQILIPIAAICLGFIMIPAAYIHNKNNETKNVVLNIFILIVCIFIAYSKLSQ